MYGHYAVKATYEICNTVHYRRHCVGVDAIFKRRSITLHCKTYCKRKTESSAFLEEQTKYIALQEYTYFHIIFTQPASRFASEIQREPEIFRHHSLFFYNKTF